MYMDYAAEARSLSSKAGGYTRRAERDARLAEAQYEAAQSWDRHAEWLMRFPGIQGRHGMSAAEAEETARSLNRLGDFLLQASFRDDDLAADYRRSAANYRSYEASRKERLA
jgi:hypothetical protein